MGRQRTAGHGTDAGYHAHRRDRTLPCRACLAAHSAYTRSFSRQRGKCAPGLGWPLLAARGSRG